MKDRKELTLTNTTMKKEEITLLEIQQFFKAHTWLMGPSTIKRALAIWGYAALTVLMFYGVLFAMAIAFGFAGAMFGVL